MLPVPPSSPEAGGLSNATIFPSESPRRRSKSKAVNPDTSVNEGSARERTSSCTKYSSPRSQAACRAVAPPLAAVPLTAAPCVNNASTTAFFDDFTASRRGDPAVALTSIPCARMAATSSSLHPPAVAAPRTDTPSLSSRPGSAPCWRSNFTTPDRLEFAASHKGLRLSSSASSSRAPASINIRVNSAKPLSAAAATGVR
mmetsp:Transcript_117896/g.279788  ORF Transcript_117896/g.279788 Transcript_117896/m.279788 type:complete len:200 (+) Transcript_117896:166-765(+)